MNQLGTDLDRLKQSAESILDRQNNKASDQALGANLLEEIAEEETTEAEMDEERDLRAKRKLGNLTVTGPGGLEVYVPAGGAQPGNFGPTSGSLPRRSSTDDFMITDGGVPNAIDGGDLPQSTDAPLEPDQNLSRLMGKDDI